MLLQTFSLQGLFLLGVLLLGLSPVHSLLSKHQDAHEILDPSLHRLSKRDLYSDWTYVMNNLPQNFVQVGVVKEFPIAFGTTQWFASAQYYGCTIFVLAGKKSVIIGHLRQIMGNGCPLDQPTTTETVLIPEIERQVTTLDVLSDECDAGQRYGIFYGSSGTSTTTFGTGVPNLLEWFEEGGVPAQNIRYKYYRAGSVVTDDPLPGALGKTVVKWDSEPDAQGNPNGGTLTVWVAGETPRLVMVYNAAGTLTTEQVSLN